MPGVFVYGVGPHERISGFGVRQKVPADDYGMLHGLPVNGIEHGILGVFHDVQNPANTQNRTHELTCPVGDLRQVSFQPAFYLVEQVFQHFPGTIVQTDRLLLIVTGQDGFNQSLISGSDSFRDRLRGEGAAANGRLRHGVQESGGKTATTEGVVV